MRPQDKYFTLAAHHSASSAGNSENPFKNDYERKNPQHNHFYNQISVRVLSPAVSAVFADGKRKLSCKG